MAPNARQAGPIDEELDRRLMAAALRLGRRNLGQTGTNPAVGCLIVRTDGPAPVVVGRGWTARGGRPHAEQQALAEAAAAAAGATAYVTLEPCAHDGPNKPCARALVDAGIARVVSAMVDPDPRTAGKGHAIIEEAGVALTTPMLADLAARAHSGHISRITKGRPHVTLKLAVSADGMIGRRVGERVLISGLRSFETVQAMRTTYDAVMVGIGTVLADDPQLTVRLPGLEHRSPARVILDESAKLPTDSRLVESVKESPIVLVIGRDVPPERRRELTDRGVRLIECESSGDQLDFASVLRALAEHGYTRVFAEGGAKVAASLISADLVDDVLIFRASVVVGPDGVRALGGTALSAIERSPRYRLVETVAIDADVMRRYARAA
jgi:diaminohydroxyphosphoribosylaminopyrimidine deaminase/5-amino-6-(5-phosphoribosylamino)uracil reductase